MQKDFDAWNACKKRLDATNKQTPFIQEGEVWWCSIGLNIGFESHGKGFSFSRPVLILKKFDEYTFLGVPFTNRISAKEYHIKVILNTEENSVVVSQIRFYDAKRLKKCLGILDKEAFLHIRKTIAQNILGNDFSVH